MGARAKVEVKEPGAGQASMASTGASESSITPLVSPSSVNQALFEYYLDQIRDLKVEEERAPVVEPSDIKRYPFSSFLRDIRIAFGGGSFDSVGRLIVQSKPQLALIKINDKKKGYTNKRFVVEAGKYSVRVYKADGNLSCEKEIDVGESEIQVVACELSGKKL